MDKLNSKSEYIKRLWGMRLEEEKEGALFSNIRVTVHFSMITQPLVATRELRDSSGISRYIDAPRGNKSKRYLGKWTLNFHILIELRKMIRDLSKVHR